MAYDIDLLSIVTRLNDASDIIKLADGTTKFMPISALGVQIDSDIIEAAGFTLLLTREEVGMVMFGNESGKDLMLKELKELKQTGFSNPAINQQTAGKT